MLQRWDVGRAFVEYEDKDGGKRRPVLIINVNSEQCITFKITKNLTRDDELEYKIIKWQDAGLDRPSCVRLGHKVYFSDFDNVIKIGRLQKQDIDNIKILCQKFDIKLDEKLIQSSSNKVLQQNIKTEINSGKSLKQAAAIAYSIQRKNESMKLKEELSLSELVKDSINHLVNGLGRDSDAVDFADDVINDIENNYDVDVPEDPLKYRAWFDSIASEVSRQLNNSVNESVNDKVQHGVYQFSTDSIIFRGTKEECAKYIDDRPELWDDAEVYFMTPDDPHYIKNQNDQELEEGIGNKIGGKEVAKQQAIKERASLDFEVGHTFDPDDFNYFKKVCKEDGWNVTEDDFAKYFEYLDEIRAEQYKTEDLDEGYSREGYSWDEINGMVHIYEDGKLIDKYPDMESAKDAGWDLEILVEDLDQMREKALKMKENSNAFAILYGYRIKDKEVELEPEEFAAEKDYRDRIQQITNSFTKLSDKDPRGNRYGKEHDIEFYTVYPNKKQINESNSENKWDMGSDKSNLTQEELDLLERLAQKLEVNSPNGYKYAIQSTYEDYGSGMKWWNIICYNKRGHSWQVLNTKEWLDLMNTGDVDKVYQDVIKDDYFQDKQKDIKDMSMWEMFNYIKD